MQEVEVFSSTPKGNVDRASQTLTPGNMCELSVNDNEIVVYT